MIGFVGKGIGFVGKGVIRDEQERALCPACLDLNPCSCTTTPAVRARAYEIRERLFRQVAALDEIIHSLEQRAARRPWWRFW